MPGFPRVSDGTWPKDVIPMSLVEAEVPSETIFSWGLRLLMVDLVSLVVIYNLHSENEISTN